MCWLWTGFCKPHEGGFGILLQPQQITHKRSYGRMSIHFVTYTFWIQFTDTMRAPISPCTKTGHVTEILIIVPRKIATNVAIIVAALEISTETATRSSANDMATDHPITKSIVNQQKSLNNNLKKNPINRFHQEVNMSPVDRSRQNHPKYSRSQSAARELPMKSMTETSKYSDLTLPASFGRQKSRAQIQGKFVNCIPCVWRNIDNIIV